MKEVQAPVTAIAFILAAVFIPVAFLGGISGQIYASSRSPSRLRCCSRPSTPSRSARAERHDLRPKRKARGPLASPSARSTAASAG